MITTNSKKAKSIPDGSFTLGLGNPRQQSVNCLSNNDEAVSWVCTSGVDFKIDIQSQDDASRQQHLSIQSGRTAGQSLYGEQPFSIDRASLNPIHESVPSERGASYLFRASYDRTVLLAESQLSFLGSATPSEFPNPRASLSPDDRPWLCYFNNTSIEGLIFTSQRATPLTNTTKDSLNNSTETSSSKSFPFIMQITEQWRAGGTSAYCEQLASTKGRSRTTDTPKYFLNTTVIPVVSDISLNSQKQRRSDSSESACECQWVVQ